MTDSSILEKAIDALVVLNAAFINIRLYPPTSAIIAKSLDSADSILQGILEQEHSLVFAESERSLIISGHALDEKDRKRPQVTAFIELMLKLGVKSIAFERGLAKSEILSFLEVVTRKFDDLRKEGGIPKVMSEKNIKNILVDQKVYVAMDKGQGIAGDKTVQNADPPADNSPLLQIKSGIESIMRGEDSAFRDKLVMQSMPQTVLDLISRGKEKTADTILNRLGAGLLNEKAEVRSEASLALARIGGKLESEKRMDDMIKVSPGLVNWIKFETIMLPAYKHITNQLQLLSQYLIVNHRLVEAMEILMPFYLITSGKIIKNEQIEAMSENVLKGTAKEDIIKSLVKELQTNENQVCEHAVEILVMFGSNSVGSLLDQFSISGTTGDLKEGDRLHKNIFAALGRIGSRAAVPALKAIAEQTDLSGNTGYNDDIRAAAGNALEAILKIHNEKFKAASPAETEETTDGGQTPVEDELSRQMRIVDQHVQNKDTGSAVKLLFDLITKYAREKDFEKAEAMRDKLMDVEPMALNDIIRSGEIIEEEKSRSIDQAHLKLWSELYKTMTDEETSSLFFAMKSVKFGAGHTIFRKGDRDSRLYFINKGQIKLVISQGDKEVLIKELKPGDTLGEDAFFSLSLCTTSAIALSAVELNYLEKDILAKWEVKSYGIEPKLHDYYLRSKKIDDPLNDKGPQFRAQERVAISGKVKVQFMDSSGTPIGDPVIGALEDISQGGLSFYLNIKKDKIGKMFLEPRVNLKFGLTMEDSVRKMDQNGTMVAAIPHFYDYSIHVKFDNILDKKTINGVKASTDSRDGEFEL